MPEELSKERVDAYYALLLEKVDRYGFAVQYVFPDLNHPEMVPFCYTVGRTAVERPELLVCAPGDQVILAGVVNSAVAADMEDPLVPETTRDDVLKDFPVQIIRVDPRQTMMNMSRAIYGEKVTGLQIVLPDKNGRFPGDEGYDATLRQNNNPME